LLFLLLLLPLFFLVALLVVFNVGLLLSL